MSNKGIDLIEQYYGLKTNMMRNQMNLDHHLRLVAELKFLVDEADQKLKQIKKKAPELFEQLEKEYE